MVNDMVHVDKAGKLCNACPSDKQGKLTDLSMQIGIIYCQVIGAMAIIGTMPASYRFGPRRHATSGAWKPTRACTFWRFPWTASNATHEYIIEQGFWRSHGWLEDAGRGRAGEVVSEVHLGILLHPSLDRLALDRPSPTARHGPGPARVTSGRGWRKHAPAGSG